MLPVEQQQLEVMPQFPRSRPRPLSSKFSSDASDSSGNEKADGQAHEHDNEKTSISDVVSVDGDGKVEGKLSADLGSLEDGAQGLPRRPMRFEAAIFMGIATGFSFLFVIIALDRMLEESMVDGMYIRWALAAVAPLLFCVSLFFTQALVNCVFYTFGPVSQFYTNSKYYSGIAPTSDFNIDKLPHVTIQMPVYKESLEATIMPSINSIQKAMISYARQGGTSSIFVNDDGMQLLSQELREERMRFYENRNIGWVARPPHGTDGFVRAGRFKKASNMNYGLTLALRMEELLEELDKDPARKAALGVDGSDPFMDEEGVLSDHALELAVNETNGEAWASGGKALRIGEVILLVDSDTQVPEDCLRDAARELAQTPEVAILQHGSDVLQVAHHYFENITAYFPRRVNQAIAMACANGEVAPFVGHNAFLRWRAMQEVAFVDSDGKRKIWSESNVSEDFDLSLRLQVAGYTIRWATYSKGGFKEGVSLTCDDEMNRWQKYAYGASELMFRPLVQWLRHGPFAAQFIKFMGSRVPLYYKMSLLAYYWSYFGIAGSFLISVLNYVLLGFTIRVDNYYLKGFELFLACLVLFFAAGNLAHAILEYRLKIRGLGESLVANFRWLPFFLIFFQGLSLSVSYAILAHLFSYNISWSATVKEVESSNFFREVPRIWKRFYPTFIICGILVGVMIVFSTNLVPRGFVIDGRYWAVIFPLALQVGSHILYPIVLNPWLVIFSY
ncbi:hypothetical protein EXIGLDRAFT_845734 [Exidia glandulosa HHB12029]|uniref:Glycosyltransferase 2-like domain-containing protein n=1 Tax=Exidia glandulosa HHB12029 TaxID=1314781 RepID=A0A165BAX5_EXIGL|nr:hypothetical protein EXIGLDRAFT_845734 [Exidia glandulosa HHB12029]